MVCEHLAALEQALLAAGIAEDYRGQPWSKNCREWVYFPVQLNLMKLRQQFALPTCVIDEQNLDQRSGTESGFVCTVCHDAIMGRLHSSQQFP